MDKRFKVLIADDHPVVRTGLKQILLRDADVSEIEEASNSLEVLELAERQDWDLVIMDISMPGGGGLEALKNLKAHRPALPVLILSMHPENQFAHRALKAGASGYLSKDYVSATMAERLADDLDRDSDRPPHDRLSGREYSVMTMLASGKSVGDIARDLLLSVNAVSTYRARVLEKLGLKNTAELIRYVLEKGLVP